MTTTCPIDLARIPTWMPVHGGPLDGSRYYPSADPVPGGRVNMRNRNNDNLAEWAGVYEFARNMQAVVWRPADNGANG